MVKRGRTKACSLFAAVCLHSLWSGALLAEDDADYGILDPISVYAVDPVDLSLEFIEGEYALDSDTQTWRSVLHILPNALLRKQVEEFHLFSDGEEETLAYVSLFEGGDDRWVFAVDYVDAVASDEGQWVSTLVHEFAHLLGLNSRQLSNHFQSCPRTFEVEEGCARTTAWIQAWYKQFWSGERMAVHRRRLGRALNPDPDALSAFYEDHYDAFVNEYAATNPVEDFAESFSYFVLTEQLPTGDSEREQKVQFFDQYPELRVVRDHIRARTPVRRASINSEPK